MPRFLVQAFFNVSTQISPAFEMFGWNILVTIVPASITDREKRANKLKSAKVGGRGLMERDRAYTWEDG